MSVKPSRYPPTPPPPETRIPTRRPRFIPSYISTEELVGCWLPIVGKAISLKDYSGNGNDGTIDGATWTYDPRWRWALNFDGEDDYVGCGDPGTFGNEDWTLLALVQLQDVGADQGIVSWGDGDADWWWRWTLQDFTGDGNHDDFGHSYDDNASKVNTSVDDAAWVDGGTHLLATVHTEETGYDLYVDDLGVISSLADNGSLREDGVNSLWLGYDSAGGLYFASDIFMALLYTRPLSDSEISALYDKTKAAIRG